MDSKIIAIIVLCITVFMYAFGMIESKYVCQDYKEQVKELQSKLNLCETNWKLDIDLFEIEICKDICEQKDVK